MTSGAENQQATVFDLVGKHPGGGDELIQTAQLLGLALLALINGRVLAHDSAIVADMFAVRLVPDQLAMGLVRAVKLVGCRRVPQ